MHKRFALVLVLMLMLTLALFAASGQPVRAQGTGPTATQTPWPTPRPPLTPTPTFVPFGRPQLTIKSASTEPQNPLPGSLFTLTLELDNQGDRAAVNVRVALDSLDLAIPAEGSSLTLIDVIPPHKTATLVLPLALSDEATSGYHSLQMVIDNDDYSRRNYTTNISVGLTVASRASNQPVVLLTQYHTTPTGLSPGDEFTLSLTLTNNGSGEARQMTVTLGGAEGVLKPFAILNTGNVIFVPALQSGESTEVALQLILDGAADSGVYNIPVTLAYDPPRGERQSEIQMLNLVVARRPQLQVSFYEPVTTGLVSETLTLPIEMVNIGRNGVNISTLEVSGDQMEISYGTQFVGFLDGGTASSIDAVVIPRQSGSLPVVVTAHYLDDFDRPQTFQQTLMVEVEEPEVVDAATPGSQAEAQTETSLGARFLRFIRGLLGLGS